LASVCSMHWALNCRLLLLIPIPKIREDGRNGLVDLPYNWHGQLSRCTQKITIEYSKNHELSYGQSRREADEVDTTPALRIHIGKQGRELVERGKLNLTEHNAKLKSIYEQLTAH